MDVMTNAAVGDQAAVTPPRGGSTARRLLAGVLIPLASVVIAVLGLRTPGPFPAVQAVAFGLVGVGAVSGAILARSAQRVALWQVAFGALAALSAAPDAPAYSASKAGLLSYGRALRAAVADENVRVSVVCPGYVTSAMTDTHIGEQPLKIGADKAARLIGAGVERNKAVIGFPLPLYVMSLISPLLPQALVRIATKGIRFHVAPRN